MSRLTLNIDTDLDEQIKKCEELIKKYEELEGQAKQLHFITIKELAEALRLFAKHITVYLQFTRFPIN